MVWEVVQLESLVIGLAALPSCSEHRTGMRILVPRKAGNVL